MKKNKEKNFQLIVRAIKLLMQICPKYIIWSVISNIVTSSFPYFNLYMSTKIINQLSITLDKDKIVSLVLITLIGNLVLSIIKKIVENITKLHNNYAGEALKFFMLDYQNKIKYTYLEDSEVEALKTRIFTAENATGVGLSQVMYSFGLLVGTIFNIIISFSLTISLFTSHVNIEYSGIVGFVNKPYSFIVIVIMMVICFIMSIISSTIPQKKIYDLYKELEQLNILWGNTPVYEPYQLVSGMKESILDIWKQTNCFDDLINESTKILSKWSSLNKVFDLLLSFVLLVYIGAKIYIGSIMIGDLMLYVGTVAKFITSCSSLVSIYARLIYNNQFLKLLYEYIDLPDDRYLGTLPIEKRSDNEYEIEFKNVSFKYPKTNFYALKNISFKFKVGERLAIVGMNGSGKTTLIKLLTRLYEPTEGIITLNGIDIKKYNYDEYQSIFSVVFQDFNIFAFSIGDNVSCSLNGDSEKIINCLEQAGFKEKLDTLPNGIETIISKYYDNNGVEMSMGEKQKIAIARALYKDSPFVVLDEPTASLDPISEQEVYNRFNLMVKNKTAIYISHRLSSCRFCDKIAVFDKGELVQVGNHEELLKDEKSKYFELWNAQAQYYN